MFAVSFRDFQYTLFLFSMSSKIDIFCGFIDRIKSRNWERVEHTKAGYSSLGAILLVLTDEGLTWSLIYEGNVLDDKSSINGEMAKLQRL